RLVVGESAARGLARVRARVELARLGLRRERRRDLSLVGLPARVSGRVLGLPLRALLLEAFLPLVRLGVEAFGVLVVAVLVELGRHAVERGVELRALEVNALVRLLEAQRDA